MNKLSPFLLLSLGLLLGCPPSDEGDDFEGGHFAFETYDVNDMCIDGALNTIYLPEGAGSTNAFGDHIYIPGTSELPYEGSIPLQEPFDDLSVTFTGDATSRAFTGGENTQVDLDPDTYPDCKIDLAISADCSLSGGDDVDCTATLQMSNVTGADCPVVSGDPCTFTLDIRGSRVAI